jgi:phospholipid/cholesterol/gamma-HCH transport system substrate-binding protein
MREGDTGSVLALTRVLIGEKSGNRLRFVKSDSDNAAEISARGPCRCAPLGVVSARREDGDGDLIELYLRVRILAVTRGQRTPPYRTAGLVLTMSMVAMLVLTYCQFRGAFMDIERLTMISGRAGLSMDPGAKVTYNGVEIGRVGKVGAFDVSGRPKAKITLDVDPKYLKLIPRNVDASINATTVFGNKYVSFSSPKNPSAQRIDSSDVIDATHVTTEFNTLLQTVMSVADKVDPIKLNQTFAATAEALDGLGDRFGQAIVQGNQIVGDLNPQMPQIRRYSQLLAGLSEIYADAAPDLFDGLENAVATARTLNEQQANIDQALMAAVGLGNTGGDVFERGGPYLVRGTHDLITTSQTLDKYSPAFFGMLRNYSDADIKAAKILGGNGYSSSGVNWIMGAGNPYVYPDNLPRVNAQGGPEGRPGCWQPITRDLWPAPYLVMDTGASLAPYNHFEPGQPMLIDYVWGRQIGENTINP